MKKLTAALFVLAALVASAIVYAAAAEFVVLRIRIPTAKAGELAAALEGLYGSELPVDDPETEEWEGAFDNPETPENEEWNPRRKATYLVSWILRKDHRRWQQKLAREASVDTIVEDPTIAEPVEEP